MTLWRYEDDRMRRQLDRSWPSHKVISQSAHGQVSRVAGRAFAKSRAMGTRGVRTLQRECNADVTHSRYHADAHRGDTHSQCASSGEGPPMNVRDPFPEQVTRAPA
jgi:hypothetical protein